MQSLKTSLCHLAVILLQLVTMTTGTEFHCHGTCYKGAFHPEEHVSKDYALLGHSYRNLSDLTYQECFSACISDCRCLSFQTRDTSCELVEEDRATAAQDFEQVPEYTHYYIIQEFMQQDANNCLNGCCRSNPCLYGGTCTELCTDVKFKFSCACPVNFRGTVCEIAPPPHSCLDIKTREPQAASGEYKIQDSSGNFFKTYCDFSSEVDFIWTLIETFSLANLGHFAGEHFGRDFPRNSDSMNWLDFRLTWNAMNYTNNQGVTHFRATCDFEKDTFDINTDYLRGEISTVDFFSGGGHITQTCIEYERVRIFGVGCDHCTAETWHAQSYHMHLEDNSCELQESIAHSGSYREYFGYFQTINSNHQCSSSQGATTQWWLGVKHNHNTEQQQQGRR